MHSFPDPAGGCRLEGRGIGFYPASLGSISCWGQQEWAPGLCTEHAGTGWLGQPLQFEYALLYLRQVPSIPQLLIWPFFRYKLTITQISFAYLFSRKEEAPLAFPWGAS